MHAVAKSERATNPLGCVGANNYASLRPQRSGGRRKSARMILTLGDSVPWGQGLIEEHKFDAILAAAKGLPLVRAAHSGAVIGTPKDISSEVENPEVPVSWPSVWQQVQAPRDWSKVRLVLVNGGLNDVSLARILNPLTSTSQLTALVNQFCGQNMQALLAALGARLIAPDARIAVLSYYPFLSRESFASEAQFRALLEIHGVATSSSITPEEFDLSALIPQVVSNCLTFWNGSTFALQEAVTAANAALGRSVCCFVALPFTEANAMWAPHPLLWQLNSLLMPEDEVAAARAVACKRLYDDLAQVPRLLRCDRASAGHPNVEAARAIAQSLLATV